MPSDEEEFRVFYERMFPIAYRVAYRYGGSRNDAEDAAQEALARAFQRWRRLRGQPWIDGWILTTTINVLRKTGPRRARAGPNEPAPNPADVDASLDLWKAIRELPNRQAEAVVLHYLADLPIRSVAGAMGCREGTAKAHLSRARARLAGALAPLDRSREE